MENKESVSVKAVIFDLDGTLIDSKEDLADATNRTLAEEGFPVWPVSQYGLFLGRGLRNLVWNALPEDRRDDATVERCRDKILADYGRNYLVKTTMYPGVADLLDALAARHVRLCVLSNKPDSVTKKIIAELFAPWKFDCVLGAGVSVPESWHPSFAGGPEAFGMAHASGSEASPSGSVSGGGSGLSASAEAALSKSLASSERPAGGFRFLAMKPEPEAVFYICEQLGLEPAEVVYIGDSDVDMLTAANAGLRSIGVSWGFRGREELQASGAWRIADRAMEIAGILGLE